ncbi:hypothetical protein AMS68_007987 [Peltaster fructicola]|uniref:glucan 1,3-beta-glucosidase n=1 Tax=Peltaster fructicola TaxID=286661 RepID=A0A6H0Y790_9PEZI|nr:hypothetical protein AMS68_007987 [Peltaster fructicola]
MRAAFALASLALAAAPVLGRGTSGFALGTKKADGTCKYQADYEADFDAISANSDARIVRGYAASDCNNAQYILPAAKSKGFKVILGIWPDVDSSYQADKKAVTTYVPQYQDQVYAITVGSEALYRGSLTAQQLLDKINDIKSALPNTKVGTVDSWNLWNNGTGDAILTGGVSFIMANAFAFWQGQNVGSGAIYTFFDDVSQVLSHIQSVTGGVDKVEFWVGETGWPTDGGSDYGAAKAGTSNAAKFYSEGYCGILDWGVNAFYFEAFDEPWKPASIGDNGASADETHWGAMTSDRKTKFSLKC